METLADMKARMNGEGMLMDVVDVISKKNDLIKDIPWETSTNASKHMILRNTDRPVGEHKQINRGVKDESVHFKPDFETMCNIQTYNSLEDEFLMKIEGGLAAQKKYRRQNDIEFSAGLADRIAQELIIGDSSANPDAFDGLRTRLNRLGSNYRVFNAGGVQGPETTSIYIIQWGAKKTYGIFPKGGKAGLQITNKGLVESSYIDANGDTRHISHFKTKFKWECGLAIDNYRSVCRIANVTPAVWADGTVEDVMILALNSMVNCGEGAKIYVNLESKTPFDIRAKDKTNVMYTAGAGVVGGIPQTIFRSSPIRLIEKGIGVGADEYVSA